MEFSKLDYNKLLAYRKTVEQVKNLKRNPFIAMLENVRSMYNVGSAFRTCDSVLAEKIVLTGFTPTPPRDEIDKTALGATSTVPWQFFQNSKEAIQYYKSLKYNIIAVEIADNSKNLYDLNSSDLPAVFVFGNELNGIEHDTLKLCDQCVELPMLGNKHSLNVSVSLGVVMYKALEIHLQNNSTHN